MKHLLPQVPRYFKAALHTHTNISDGAPSPEEMKEIYKSKGYQILSITDHNIIVDHSYLNEEDFLLLTGAEYNVNEPGWAERRFWVKTYHLNFIAKRPDNLWQPFIPKAPKDTSRHYLEHVTDGGFPWVYDVDNINAMIAEANRQGFLVMYNHPVWSLETYPDYMPLEGLWGMELYNYSSMVCGYHDYDNAAVYRDLMRRGGNLYPLGADDSHSQKDLGGAWIMVGAEKLEYASVIDALEKGDFYVSMGPEIHSLTLDGSILTIRCSDAKMVTLESGIRFGRCATPVHNDGLLREASFDIQPWLDVCRGDGRDWLRLVVHGPYGQLAATRGYRAEELRG
jgi:hypothetical protein